MNRLNNLRLFVFVSMLMLSSSLLHAAEAKFSIIPVGATITAMLLPTNFTETVQYRVTNQTKITRTLTMVPITGISQTTTGAGVCPNPFTLASGQSCLLTLILTGNQISATGVHDGPVICKTKSVSDPSPDPFLCSKPGSSDRLAISITTPGQYAYVANQFGNSVTFCQANPVSGFLSQCAVTATGLAGVEGIGFNPARTLFYTANPTTNSISVCQVNSTTGALSGCVDAGGSGFDLPNAVAFSPDGSIFYTANLGGLASVSACLVNASTGMLSACVNNNSPTFGDSADMTINATGNKAYVANRSNNTISVCNVAGQVVNACIASSGSQINGPEGVTLSASGLKIYITNANNRTVTVCDILQDGTGLLSNCSVTDGSFSGTGNIGLNNLNTLAYVPNELLNTVFVCNVTDPEGQLTSCQRSRGSQFTGPAGIVLN